MLRACRRWHRSCSRGSRRARTRSPTFWSTRCSSSPVSTGGGAGATGRAAFSDTTRSSCCIAASRASTRSSPFASASERTESLLCSAARLPAVDRMMPPSVSTRSVSVATVSFSGLEAAAATASDVPAFSVTNVRSASSSPLSDERAVAERCVSSAILSCTRRSSDATSPGWPRGCRPSRARSTPACRHGRRAHRSRRARRPSEGVRQRSSAAPGACAHDRCRVTPNAKAAAGRRETGQCPPNVSVDRARVSSRDGTSALFIADPARRGIPPVPGTARPRSGTSGRSSVDPAGALNPARREYSGISAPRRPAFGLEHRR